MRLIDGSGTAPARPHRGRDDPFAFAYYRGQMSQMARKLGIGRSTLYSKMKEYGFHQADDESLMDKDPDAGDAAA